MSYLIKPNQILNSTKFLPKMHHQIRKISQIPDSKKHLVPSNGTYPKGFKATGIHCGIKKDGIKDLALIVSEKPCTSSAVFTTNVFKAAPVLISREILDKKNGQNIYSLIVNSGCANAVTGTKGLENAKKMVDTASKLNGVEESSLVMSTGVIGQHLPIENIVNGINQIYDLIKQQTPEELHEGWMKAAESIMTTDTFPKLRSKQFTLPSSGLKYNMAGTTKGAGMMHPNMATLLATVVTDVPISAKALNEALKYVADRSFNSINVDNDMSTNDTFAIFANGAATTDGKVIIDDVNGKDFIQFRDDLSEFSIDLAKLIVRDGEGATKFVTIHVKDAKTFADAKKVASAISTSSLVKTALYGQDANWGRILCAVGYAGVSSIIPNKVSVSFIPTDGTTPLRLLTLGEPENVDETRASEILAMEDLEIRVELGIGNEEAKLWTCDFSHEYVTINADYRT